MSKSNRIKELTKSLNITSRDLSKNTGIPYDSLKNYELGRREISGKALATLEIYFGASGAYILGESEIRKPTTPSWNHIEITDATSANFHPLLSKILEGTKNSSDSDKELIFSILTELNKTIQLNKNEKEQKKVCLTFLEDSIDASKKLFKAKKTSSS